MRKTKAPIIQPSILRPQSKNYRLLPGYKWKIGSSWCSDPRARPDPVGESEPKARGRSVEAMNQIHLVIVLSNFSFQKCRDPNPRHYPVGGSKSEPDLFRHFQLSYQNIWLVLFILDFVITRKHFILGKPINIYTFKRLIPLTFIKMHFTKIMIKSSNCFTKCQCLKEME